MKIGIIGANGRMGRQLLQAVLDTEGAELAGAAEHSNSDALGKDVGELIGTSQTGIKITDDLEAVITNSDAVIEFTLPQPTLEHIALTQKLNTPHIIGTTGMTEGELAKLDEASETIPIVHAHNFSVGVNLLSSLVERAASILPKEVYDIEVLEMHHKRKIDAPSGTALSLGEAAAKGRDVALNEVACYAREGQTGARPEGEIGFATLRGGDVVGDHTVMYASDFERIELTHKAQDRSVFAHGAVRAAKWLADKPAGLYSMQDVLGL